MAIPKVFVSYSHDDREHKDWVLKLSTRLRTENSINVILDQWELQPGDDIATYMESNLRDSDYILMICTENYVKKANEGLGGVAYEKMIITSDLLKNIDSNKVIPIIRQEGEINVPTFMQTKKYINFSHKDEYEFSYDELVRTLHNSPLYIKPDISDKEEHTEKIVTPEKVNDPLRDLMTIVAAEYERDASLFHYGDLRSEMSDVPRVIYDTILVRAEKEELLIRKTNSYGAVYYVLTDKGRFYIIENLLKSESE